MKVYLAGPSAELDRVEAVRAWLESNGHEITHPWWEDVRAARNAGLTSDDDLTDEVAIYCAERDIAGVRAANVVMVLARSNGELSPGAMAELGAALALDKAVIVIGYTGRSIFARGALDLPADSLSIPGLA